MENKYWSSDNCSPRAGLRLNKINYLAMENSQKVRFEDRPLGGTNTVGEGADEKARAFSAPNCTSLSFC